MKRSMSIGWKRSSTRSTRSATSGISPRRFTKSSDSHCLVCSVMTGNRVARLFIRDGLNATQLQVVERGHVTSAPSALSGLDLVVFSSASLRLGGQFHLHSDQRLRNPEQSL